jgi:hypothetical protein
MDWVGVEPMMSDSQHCLFALPLLIKICTNISMLIA